uniref:Small ribosomal subunit protein uS17c n=1 Tax=Polysiphonia sertularioides TaxID=945028 RepID=A0A1Z1M9W3_9FLOR|nr:ribosomal protein S17 [Polysiphonia sertularioides]ARW62534.1 ribosomal protein S17 [Polysiphonia sertularioides]
MPKKETIGTVINNKMDKTVTVIVKKPIKHKKYKKILNRTNKYYADDPLNIFKIGDVIKIQETKPISKNKRWKIIELIQKK